MSIRLRVLSSNEQIHIADLMDIRASYSEEDMDLASIEKRFRSELLENYNRVFLSVLMKTKFQLHTCS